MWEGILDKWKYDIPEWFSCPPSPSPNTAHEMGTWQKVLTLSERFRSSGGGPEWDDDVLCPYSWAKSIHQLNCDVVWPKELDEPPYNSFSQSLSSNVSTASQPDHSDFSSFSEDATSPAESSELLRGVYLELDTPEYTGVIHKGWVVEKLMAMAGIRLALVLNWLFADVDDIRAGGLLL